MFPAVVPGITWRWIFDGLFGVLNEVLYRVGYYAETDVPIAWLGQTSTALAATIVANIWRGFPFMMVLLLAGLQSINRRCTRRRRSMAPTPSAASGISPFPQ